MNATVVADPDPAQVIRLLWQARWRIISVALVCGVLGATYALLATPIYRAQVVLLPVQNKGTSGITGQLGALSGLAGLAGINLGGLDKAEPLAVLSSHDFSRSFIEDQGLVTVLLAEKWDPVKKTWKKPGPNQPDIRDAVEYFDKDVRRVGEDKKTGVVVLSVDWTSPRQAAEWANGLASQVNAQMRARAIAEAERSIGYLRAELQATTQVSLQQSISKLIESQMQTMMVARGNDEYAFRVIDSARVPKKRLSPKRSLITLGAAVVGGFLACAWVMMFPRGVRLRAEPPNQPV